MKINVNANVQRRRCHFNSITSHMKAQNQNEHNRNAMKTIGGKEGVSFDHKLLKINSRIVGPTNQTHYYNEGFVKIKGKRDDQAVIYIYTYVYMDGSISTAANVLNVNLMLFPFNIIILVQILCKSVCITFGYFV